VSLDAGAVSTGRAWWIAARPRTLPVSLAPVVVGTAVAIGEGRARPGPALAAALGALLLQLVSNFSNDLFDFEKGADTAERIGPPRVAQLGLLTPGAIRVGIALTVLAALLVGLYLVAVAGWPVVVVGLLSIAAALAYTGGPWPFGYKGLGDLAVFVFFGVVAVTGTHYVQALSLSGAALAASVPVGALATAILVVNNVRDIDTDRAAGKRTLAVRLGRSGARAEYALLIGVAFAAPAVFAWMLDRSLFVLLPIVLLPRAISLVRTVGTRTDGPSLNEALAGTAQLVLAYAVLLAVGWLL
jgi:1,4-dihydroxy-2-naphthoate octaprenyltransferase